MRRPITLIAAALLALAMAPAPADAALKSCDKYASLSGDDGDDGSQAHPYATADRLIESLDPGEAGCLVGPGPFADVDMPTGGGTQTAPILLRSAGSAPAAIRGRFWLRAGVHDVTLAGLKLDGGTFAGIAMPIDGDRITLLGNEITRDTTNGACLYAGNETGDIADDLRVEGNRIHGCANGVQVVKTRRAVVADNTIYENAGRGVELLPDADDSTIERNVIAFNGGQGVQFGGAVGTSDRNVVRRNVITDNGGEDLGDEGPAGTGNTAIDNCIDQGDEIEASSGSFTESGNVGVADPDYTSVGTDDYTLQDGSPCEQRGPLPGVQALPASAIGSRTAQLRGTLNPHGQTVTEYFFRYAASGGPSIETTHEPGGEGSLPFDIAASLSNLQPNTTYSYRLVARNPSGGEAATTPLLTFRTDALPDADTDGVPDETDSCDNVSGGTFDANGDGCPDDTDGDGVLDQSDGCRTTGRGPVDRDGNGCPDDSDLDGVADERDACDGLARGPLDANGDGCPDDTDGDGVFDAGDSCRGTPRGTIDRDNNGCPDDSDRDGIADADDRCPRLAAGRYDDPPNGCPGPQPTVRARNARIGFFTRGRRIFVLAVRLRNAEKGARVRISCKGCKVKGSIRRWKGGALNFTRGLKAGKRATQRSVITVRVTKRGKAGRVFVLRWSKRQDTWLDTERCIPIGTSKPRPLQACGDRTK